MQMLNKTRWLLRSHPSFLNLEGKSCQVSHIVSQSSTQSVVYSVSHRIREAIDRVVSEQKEQAAQERSANDGNETETIVAQTTQSGWCVCQECGNSFETREH
eukprot:Selendium_serpulae@DN6080_c3_g1_i1.p1